MAFWEYPEQNYTTGDAGSSPAQAKAYARQVLYSFDAQIAETDCETVFVSSEAIGKMAPGAMARFGSFLEQRFENISAVYDAIEPVATAMSFLQERLKGGHETTIKNFLNERTMNFSEVARMLTAVFGSGRACEFLIGIRSAMETFWPILFAT